MSVCLYTDVDFCDIRIDSKPYKKRIQVDYSDKIVYYIDIEYSRYIQIPRYKLLKFSEDENTISVCIDGDFYLSFMEPLESYIKDMVYNKSRSLFNKEFTIEKISRCFVSNVERIDNNYILTLPLSDFVSVYNKNKVKIDFRNYDLCNLDVICILSIENLQFIDNLFTCNIVVEQLKLYDDMKLTQYSIIDIDTEDDTEDDTEINLGSNNLESFTNYVKMSSRDDICIEEEVSDDILEDEYFKQSTG